MRVDDAAVARVFLAAVAATGVVTAVCQISPADVRLVPCPFRQATGLRCPGCGMTRACTAAVRGHFRTAWDHHPASFFLLALAAAAAAVPVRLRAFWARLPSRLRTAATSSALLLVLGLWLLRLLEGGT